MPKKKSSDFCGGKFTDVDLIFNLFFPLDKWACLFGQLGFPYFLVESYGFVVSAVRAALKALAVGTVLRRQRPPPRTMKTHNFVQKGENSKRNRTGFKPDPYTSDQSKITLKFEAQFRRVVNCLQILLTHKKMGVGERGYLTAPTC